MSMPRKTRERRLTLATPSPVALFAVPVRSPSKMLMMHTGVPPEDSGSGGPNVFEHETPAGQSALLSHSVSVVTQRFWWVGPMISHSGSSPQLHVGSQSWPGQSASTSQTSPVPPSQRRRVRNVIDAPSMMSLL